VNIRAVSLRTRVAVAAALGALIVVSGVAVGISVAIARNNLDHLDRQLDTAAQLLELNADAAQMFVGRVGDVGAFAVTLRDGADVRSTPTRIPPLSAGHHSVAIDAVTYRVATVTMNRADGPLSISVATPIQQAQTITRIQQQRVLLTSGLAVIVAMGLGWSFGGRAVRPLVDLARRIDAGTALPEGNTNIREANQLAAAIRTMLGHIAQARSRTDAALETARTFAATAAHELRTPLTAMRTDLEVILGLDLPPQQRTEILRDVLRKQSGVESTLSALELLASGELVRTDQRVPADVVELADEAVRDAGRRHRDVDIRVRSDPPLTAELLPAGFRLALDNAIVNAVKHGRATRIDITAEQARDRVLVSIDDNGRGVPEAEREAVFARFYRGDDAARDGSGLGLALVAQQAELHGGHAYFTDSPLGGARLVLDLARSRV
jgi:two-component system sensor histidine kinase PrrB